MSFGDEGAGSVPGLFRQAAKSFDSVLAPAFDPRHPPAAAPTSVSSASPPSMVNRPVSTDTPGRHKTLLGR